MRRFAVRTALMAGSLLFCLGVAEIGTRAVGWARGIDFSLYMRELSRSDRLPPGLQVPHPTRRWALNPGAQLLASTSDFSVIYRVNDAGMRDRDYALAKPPGVTRIVALGDSLTFGEGVPYGARFTDLAEDRLRGVEILTLAVPGYGLDQMLAMFADVGMAYRPDVIMLVVAWTVASRHNLGPNWLAGVTPSDILVASTPTTVYRVPHPPARASWVSRSWFLSYVEYVITLWRLRPAMETADQQTWGARAIDDTTPHPDWPVTRAMDAYLTASLRWLAPLAAQLGARLVVVNIDTRWRPIMQIPGVTLIDFGDDLRAAARTRTLRFTYDPHYNVATNRLLGNRLASALGNYLSK